VKNLSSQNEGVNKQQNGQVPQNGQVQKNGLVPLGQNLGDVQIRKSPFQPNLGASGQQNGGAVNVVLVPGQNEEKAASSQVNGRGGGMSPLGPVGGNPKLKVAIPVDARLGNRNRKSQNEGNALTQAPDAAYQVKQSNNSQGAGGGGPVAGGSDGNKPMAEGGFGNKPMAEGGFGHKPMAEGGFGHKPMAVSLGVHLGPEKVQHVTIPVGQPTAQPPSYQAQKPSLFNRQLPELQVKTATEKHQVDDGFQAQIPSFSKQKLSELQVKTATEKHQLDDGFQAQIPSLFKQQLPELQVKTATEKNLMDDGNQGPALQPLRGAPENEKTSTELTKQGQERKDTFGSEQAEMVKADEQSVNREMENEAKEEEKADEKSVNRETENEAKEMEKADQDVGELLKGEKDYEVDEDEDVKNDEPGQKEEGEVQQEEGKNLEDEDRVEEEQAR
jgi:hypothetical protein